jgi:hypothetical protein
MLPGFRFLFATIVLSVSVLVFGLGAAALLRAAHDNFANLPSAKAMQEAAVAHDQETRRATLALMRVEMIAEQQEHVQKMAAAKPAIEAERSSYQASDAASSADVPSAAPTGPVASDAKPASDVKFASDVPVSDGKPATGDASAAIAPLRMASNPPGSGALTPNAEGRSVTVNATEPAPVSVAEHSGETAIQNSDSDAKPSIVASPAAAPHDDAAAKGSQVAAPDLAKTDSAASDQAKPDAAIASNTPPGNALPETTKSETVAPEAVQSDIKADAGSGVALTEPGPNANATSNASADAPSQQPRTQVAALVDPVAVRTQPPAPLGNAVANSAKASKIELMSDLKLIMSSFPAPQLRLKKSANIRAAREARLVAIARRRRFAMRARAAASAQQQQIYQQQYQQNNPFGIGANAATAAPNQAR